VAETAPPPSPIDRIQQWLVQDGATSQDVSHETSPETAQEPELEADAGESDEYEPEPNAQVEGDEAAEPEQIRTFGELAKHLGNTEDELAKHLHVVGRDGKEVPLHEVLTAYRTPAPERVELEKASARLTELEAGREEVARAAEELRQTAQALAKHVKSQERSPEQWAALQRDNPNAFYAARFEHMEQVRQLEIADRQYQAARQQQYAEQQKQVDAFRREQALKLRAAVPEWADTRKMQSDLEGVSKYLVSQGLSEAEVSGLTDHRDWLIARKAMQFDALQAKKPALLERVRALPKVIAPGASSGADRGTSARQAKTDSDLMERLKGGDKHAAAALISNRIAASARKSAARTLASGRRS
jgi:hypothetical protein